jgi:predicted nucleic acid-binding protein
VILCDTGPMVALVDYRDIDHARCKDVLNRLPAEPLMTTWSCFTEAMYLLYRSGGYRFQQQLWAFVERGVFRLHSTENVETDRIRRLMQAYNDAPMDLADASLVSAAERLGAKHVFTLDGHFHGYRTADGHLEVLPLN